MCVWLNLSLPFTDLQLSLTLLVLSYCCCTCTFLQCQCVIMIYTPGFLLLPLYSPFCFYLLIIKSHILCLLPNCGIVGSFCSLDGDIYACVDLSSTMKDPTTEERSSTLRKTWVSVCFTTEKVIYNKFNSKLTQNERYIWNAVDKFNIVFHSLLSVVRCTGTWTRLTTGVSLNVR